MTQIPTDISESAPGVPEVPAPSASPLDGSLVLRVTDGCQIHEFDTAVERASFLVSLPDGSALRISRSVRDLVTLFDGERSLTAVAAMYSQASDGRFSENDVFALVERTLLVRGILAADGVFSAEPRKPTGKSALFLFRFPLIPARAVSAVATVTSVMYRPPNVAAALTLAVGCLAYVVATHRLPPPSSTLRAEGSHFAYLWVLAGILIHEFGHASAARYYRCANGPIGFGMYLMFPTFYTDVTAVWRISRLKRAVVDVGGLYFQSVYTALCLVIYSMTGSAALGLSIYASTTLMVYNLLPCLRRDGYWLVADLTGVPDLNERMRRFNRLWWKPFGKLGPRSVFADIRSRRIATAVILYFVAAYVTYGVLLRYLVRRIGWLTTAYPKLFATFTEALHHVDSPGGVRHVYAAFVPLLVSSNIIVFVLIRSSQWLIRVRARRRSH